MSNRSVSWFVFLTCTTLLACCVTAVTQSHLEIARFSSDAATIYQRTSQIAAPAGADVLVVEDEENLVFDAQGNVKRSLYLLYKVLTQRGAQQWADLSVPWDPWRQERPAVRARVITSDGVAHPLDDKTITDAPAKETQDSVFSNRRVLRAPLPAIATGSLVEEEHTINEKPLFTGAGIMERFYFGGSVPIEHTRLVLDAPSSVPIRYTTELLADLKPQRTQTDGRVHIVFESGHIDAIEEVEPELPSDIAAYPSVAFSTGSSWQQVAEEYSNIVDQQIANADLKSTVAQLISGKKARDQKITAILQYLDREVRYTGVEFGEAALVPRPPAETIARKYGDCKDKATLLVAMLRAANIPAYLALLNAGSRHDVPSDLPGMGLFDHAIVYLPGSPDLWIDATDEYARLGQLPSPDQERLALVARIGSNALVRTPATSSLDNTIIKKREIYLADDAAARVVETMLPSGSDESSFRRAYIDKESKSVKDGLSDYMHREYLAENLDRIDHSDPNNLSAPFQLVLESKHARRGVTDLSGAAAAIRFENLFDRLPSDLCQREKDDDKKHNDADEKPKKMRTADYQLPEAFVTEWQYTIVPPAGFQPKPLPQDADFSFGPAKLHEEFAADKDGTVHAIIRFDTVKRRFTVAEATDLRDKVAGLLEGEPILIYFQPIGDALLNQGKTREALQSYHDVIAAHPASAVHHLRLALAFLNAGLGEAARSEARAAVTLEPNSALAQKTLAGILEYDIVGRRFRPGSDYAGAEAAFRAAEKLDPDDSATVGDLAILLEYNHWGLRYGPGARLKDSIAEYRKLSPKKLAEVGVQNNLAYTLFYDGQFSEAQKYAQSLNPQLNDVIVASEAALNGSQTALAEARKRTSNEEQFKKVAEDAGQLLVKVRKYNLGADLEEAGASGNDASDTSAYAALYRKTVPREQLQFPDDPVGVALRFYLLQQDPNLTFDKLRSVTSHNGSIAMVVPQVVEEWVKEANQTLSRKAREGEFSDIGFDLAITRAQPKLEGNDATGYKVILWPSTSYKTADYVVKENGHYKILSTSRFPCGIGLEVLDRIAANDLAGARMLFDWLREDEHLPGGDDPLGGWTFSGWTFVRFWSKGKPADAPLMKLVAASILAGYKQTAAVAMPILQAADNSLHNDSDGVNTKLALLAGYNSLKDYEHALAVSVQLAQLYPESKRAFVNESFNLRALGRLDDAEKLARDRLQRIPGDIDASQALITIAKDRDDYAKVRDLYVPIIAGDKVEATDLNNFAWNSLFLNKADASDVDYALKAAQLSEKKPFTLHTLGCVYAFVGKTREAQQVFLQGMDADDLDEPNSSYWLAFGLIAEQFGERDLAIADYRRATKPEEWYQMPSSSYNLAQLRLQALHAATKPN